MKLVKITVIAATLAAAGASSVQATERCPYWDYQNLDYQTKYELCTEWSRSRPGTGTSDGDGNEYTGTPNYDCGSYSCQGVDV